MNYYIEVLKKYAEFSGRARRKEYWFFVLFNLLISIGIAVVDSMLGTYSTAAEVGTLGLLYSLAVLIPSFAVSLRRLHDSDRSGWWFFVMLVPLIGILVFVLLMAQDGTAGANRFGPDPKLEDADLSSDMGNTSGTPGMLFCTSCGEQLPAGTKVCSACGERL